MPALKLRIDSSMTAPRFIFILRSYDYNMHAEVSVFDNLYLVTLPSSKQCSQFERFRLQVATRSNDKQNLQFQNKIAEASKVNRNTL